MASKIMAQSVSLNIQMCAMVAYFPNFGGYVPYTDWRCLSGSSECLRRTSEFVDQGKQDKDKLKIYLLDDKNVKLPFN